MAPPGLTSWAPAPLHLPPPFFLPSPDSNENQFPACAQCALCRGRGLSDAGLTRPASLSAIQLSVVREPRGREHCDWQRKWSPHRISGWQFEPRVTVITPVTNTSLVILRSPQKLKISCEVEPFLQRKSVQRWAYFNKIKGNTIWIKRARVRSEIFKVRKGNLRNLKSHSILDIEWWECWRRGIAFNTSKECRNQIHELF